ncbi:MAG: amidohydrolase family protein [Vampirovibrionales bacterium]|nr:amidohydrolase family protein [Vampirovibrionales bacterium]
MGSPTATTNPFPLGDTSVSADWVLPVVGQPMANTTVGWNTSGTITNIVAAEAGSSPKSTGGKKTILTPGLVNTHTHLELTFPRTIPPDPNGIFSNWLSSVIATVQQVSQQPNATEQLHRRIAAGGSQALSSGTTCVNDITRCLETPAILSTVGLRGVVSWEWFHPAWDSLDTEPITQAFQKFQQAFVNLPLLKAGLSPHSFYNVSPAALLALLKACEDSPPWLIHAHVGECNDELAWLHQQPNGLDALHATMRGQIFGPQPHHSQAPFPHWLHYLTHHGVLPSQQRWVLAHGAVLSEEEWALLAQWKQQGFPVGVSHCLQSNQWLHQHSIPCEQVNRALKCSGLLSIGTDSPLSSPEPSQCLDIRTEARALQAHHGLPAETLLQLATVGGAQQLGIGNTIGQLTKGYQADMVLWEVPADVPCTTAQEAIEAWLHPQTTLKAVWVNGTLQQLSNSLLMKTHHNKSAEKRLPALE